MTLPSVDGRREVAVAIILTVASSKGGAGKTTVAQAIASSLAGECRVTVIDADPSRGLARWAQNIREGSGAMTVHSEADHEALAHLIPDAAEGCDLLLIDTAGFGNLAANVAMTASDAVLVPTKSSEIDVTETERTVRQVRGIAKAARRDIQVRVVLNSVKRRTDLWRHAAEELARSEMPVLQTSLSDLVAYGEVSFSGRMPAPSSTAGAEIAALVEELRGIGWLPQANRSPLLDV